ncbi:aspartate/glutamate racemase family protein [Radiobacillus sp. PE A8.2]|uniref:aspartate/glutamate racemase family protein n=1 Tax=Radiobacillus sp. PE A8.2 TaxID=3380349 RepID=UPI00388F1B8F
MSWNDKPDPMFQGADAILNQCSSVGEAVDIARNMISIPYVKVDEAMAEEAVKIGGKVSVIATVESTMAPSVRLIERTAEKLNKKIEINQCLVEGALNVLMKEGDKEKHNQMVLSEIEKVEHESDVIVLAQGSMIVLLPYLNHIKKPVLTSPRSGVMGLQQVLHDR